MKKNLFLSLVVVFAITFMLTSPGFSGIYKPSNCNTVNPSNSYYKEADYINPWGHQVVVFKKYNKPYHQRSNQVCSTYTTIDDYHWKNIKRTFIQYRPVHSSYFQL